MEYILIKHPVSTSSTGRRWFFCKERSVRSHACTQSTYWPKSLFICDSFPFELFPSFYFHSQLFFNWNLEHSFESLVLQIMNKWLSEVDSPMGYRLHISLCSYLLLNDRLCREVSGRGAGPTQRVIRRYQKKRGL